MRLYIASALHNRIAARDFAAALRSDGHTVLSTWHEHAASTVEVEARLSHAAQRSIQRQCRNELVASDGLVWLYDNSDRVGNVYEAGVADGLGMPAFACHVSAFEANAPPPTLMAYSETVILCADAYDVRDALLGRT